MRPWQKLLARAGHLRPLLLAHQSLPAPFPDAGLTTPEPNKSHILLWKAWLGVVEPEQIRSTTIL